jgi:hypothetical protein
MTKEELIAQFKSTDSVLQIIQKWQFAALSDDDFKLLVSIPKYELKIRCTPGALKYLNSRKAGAIVKDDSGNPPKRLDADRASRILDNSIMNPRGI